MSKILNAEEGKHVVTGYSFKNFNRKAISKDEKSNLSNIKNDDEVVVSNNQHSAKLPPEVSSVVVNASNNQQIELIEKLLEKSDDFSSSIIRLEEQLQKQAEEYEKKFADIKENSYKLGLSEGYNKAKTELEAKINERLSKLIESIHKVEDVYKEYQIKAENIEKELVGVSVDIAEEVIAKELSKHSKEVALNLTKELISDITEATKIEIKVNPLDYDYIKDNLDLKKVKIIPDNAISIGGVVILSDAGNIEGEITERFKAIKKHILKS